MFFRNFLVVKWWVIVVMSVNYFIKYGENDFSVWNCNVGYLKGFNYCFVFYIRED